MKRALLANRFFIRREKKEGATLAAPFLINIPLNRSRVAV